MKRTHPTLHIGLGLSLLLLNSCAREFTVDTFRFKRDMTAGEIVREADLEPISIPFSKGSANSPAPAGDVVEQVTPEKAERVWITTQELDQFIGRPLTRDVEKGDQLVHKLFTQESET